MTEKKIIIKDAGVIIFGFPIGLAPTVRDFELVFKADDVRQLSPYNGRQLRINDSSGLSWLIDVKRELVLWFDVRLASFSYRPKTDHDPSNAFKGQVRIAQYTVQGPFSFETGEIIRKVTIPTLSINLVPDAKHVGAINVAFETNDRRLA